MTYDAFISYSHRADALLAKRARRALARLTGQRRLAGRHLRIYLDHTATTVSGSHDLWTTVRTALADSEYLLVFASPESARSTWVGREIEYWLERHARAGYVDRLIIVHTGGTLRWDKDRSDFSPDSNALPPALRGRYRSEPLWVDLTWFAGARFRRRRLRQDLATIAAELVGRPKEEILRIDASRTRQIVAASVAPVVLLTGFTGYQVKQSWDQAERSAAKEFIRQSKEVRARDPELGELLSLAAVRIERTKDTRSAVLDSYTYPGRSSTPTGMSDAVLSASADGKTIALGDSAGRIELRTDAGRVPSGPPLAASASAVLALAFTPDGRTLAVSTKDGTIALWNVAGRTRGRVIHLPATDQAYRIAFAEGGRLLIAGTVNDAWRWDLTDGSSAGARYPRCGSRSTRFALDRLTHQIVIGSADGSICRRDVRDGGTRGRDLTGSKASITALAVSPDGAYAVSYAAGPRRAEKLIRFWNLRTGNPSGSPVTASAGADNFTFSADSRTFASSDANGLIQLRDTETREAIGSPLPGGEPESVSEVVFLPSSTEFVSINRVGRISRWDVAVQRPTRPVLPGSGRGTQEAVFSPDGGLLATAQGDQTVRLWHVPSGTPDGEPFTGHESPPRSVAFSPDGALVASGSGRPMIGCECAIRVWSVADGRQIGAPMTGHTDRIEKVAFSPDGTVIASAGSDGTVRLWDVRSHRPVAVLRPGTSRVYTLAFSPDGRLLVAGGDDGVLRVWAMPERTLLRTISLTNAVSGARTIAFSADGTLLAVGGANGAVRFFDPSTGEQQGDPITVQEAEGDIHRLAFSPDGRVLAVVAAGKSVRLIDLATRTQIGRPMIAHRDTVSAVAFAPSGRWLMSASLDNRTQLWDVGYLSDPVAALCAVVRRPLSEVEWDRYGGKGVDFRAVCP
ncbi:TIR domain-containing protein [Cryptosporangium japonicum]|uniref:TIR domain-containing protein n=1 Tax=Cryptosporangium japonicum TaxID=80872 RepID=A0ABN0U377_9ACTN